MQKIKKTLIPNLALLIIFVSLVVPAVTFAVPTSLIPCSNTDVPVGGDPSIVTPPGICDFNALMTLINTVIDFILTKMVIPIAAIMFAYAGFSMVTAPGSEAKTKAKGVFTNAVIGLILAFACWIIVKLILSILGFDGAWIGF